MIRKVQRLLSILLILTLITNLIPVSAFATAATDAAKAAFSNEKADISDAAVPAENFVLSEPAESVEILEEDLSRRDEYYKEFVLSNGQRLATIYPTAVHYTEDGQWKEIDNTLKTAVFGGQTTYTNTAGLWQIHFPQQLRDSNAISITKDGYTVSFSMAGELRKNEASATAVKTAQPENGFIVRSAEESAAQIQYIDTNSLKETAKFEETIPDSVYSKLTYPAVYNNTTITYDLDGNRLKESIIIQSYDAALYGYRYTLNTGGLVPVLNADQSIDLYDPVTNAIVMTMDAPFMLDANDEFCGDVQVSLVQDGNGYLLSYALPQQWLAAEDRAWPVILDPVVSANNEQNNIQDITVAENATESNTAASIKCGYNPTKGILRTYLRYNRLPFLGSADVIVNATIDLIKVTDSSVEAPIEVHKVTAAWNAEGMTWSNMPGFDTTVEDITVVEDADTYSWDVTEIVRGWYADTTDTLDNNTGMMFKATNEIETGGTNNWQQFCSSDSGSTRPVLNITYCAANGLESYWDTTAVSAGRAGTGYVQNYSGNLTWVHEDLGFDGNRMPVFISHIYNAHDAYDAEANAGNDPFGMGNGWRTNFNQTVIQNTNSTENATCIWEDGDGTQHSFAKTSSATEYKDVDGLGLTLTVSSSGYVITDKHGNTSTFDTNGRLTAQTDNQSTSSSIRISYVSTSSNLISQILDGVDRKYTFTYENGLLNRITYYGNNETVYTYIDFGYTSSNLTSITYKDGEKTLFTYHTSKNALKTVTDIDGYQITYDYNMRRRGKPSCVASITESDDGTTGRNTTLEYAYKRTTVTDYNGNAQTYYFNDWGNTASSYDSEGNGVFYQYMTDYASSSTRNKVLVASQPQDTVVNWLNDSSFESSTLWTTKSSYVSSAKSTSYHYLGAKSLQVISNNSAVEGIYFGTYNVAAGESYTFSAYLRIIGSNLRLRIKDDAGTVVESETAEINGGWLRREVTYTNTSSSTRSITLSTYHISAGTAYIDCVQLEKNESVSRYNLLNESDISSTSSASSYWKYYNDETAGTLTYSAGVTAPSLTTYRFKINGSRTATRYISQTVPVSGVSGDRYVFSGWVNGDALPDKSSTRFFGLKLVFNNSSGTQTTWRVSANPNLNDIYVWQYLAKEAVATQPYDSITFIAEYSGSVDTAYFDGLQLFKEKFGESYSYDSNGNVKTVVDVLGNTTNYTYDSQNNLIETVLPTGVTITNTYDSYHNVIKTVETGLASDSTRTTINSYDAYGNLTQSAVNSDGQDQTTKSTYTAEGNLLYSVTDANGNTTLYGYGTNTSALFWVYEPKDSLETRREYTYDSMYRVIKVQEAPLASATDKLSAAYTYTDDQLTKITTPSTVYSLTYGDFGLRTCVSIGLRNLATYQYTSEKHYLEKLDYGNGDGVKYTYDDLGRVTKETYYEDGSTTASRTVTYTYDPSGKVASIHDSSTGITTSYQYDSFGRLALELESGGDETHSVRYTYDAYGNVSQAKERLGPYSYVTYYTYDTENRPTAVSHGSAGGQYTYDALGRVIGRVSTHQGTRVLSSTVAFRSVGTNQTSDQVSALNLVADGYNVSYHYTYDANGNITSVSDGTYTTTYAYDASNRLWRENNQEAGLTWTWEYDTAGNILNKKEYAYTTASGVTADDRIYYLYEDSTWGDLLTSYDGKAITYDTVGNMLSDGTWTYNWIRGRTLSSMHTSSYIWFFSYDANGMRTERYGTQGTYTYTYVGDQLTHMTYGTTKLHFKYHADGKPLSVSYNGTYYYYALNLQGDVVAILDSSGTAVVKYVYDAWGRVITYTGSKASTLGRDNPLRYRGYVYDRETGLYYLQSRYYNPTIGRFINADKLVATTQALSGNNLFVYCHNNPVRFSDIEGEWPDDYAGMVGAAIGNWLYQIITTDENETNVNGEKTLNAKLKSTGKSAINNVEFSAGVGLGSYVEFDLFDTIGVGVGIYSTNTSVNYGKGVWNLGQEAYSGISATFLWNEIGVAQSGYAPYNGNWQFEQWVGYNDTQETVTLFSASLYLFGGGSLRIGFDLNSFLQDISSIWGI